MTNQIDIIKQQHIDSYKDALIKNVENNTNVLVYEDIKSLLKKPPLDSMDLINSKFLNISKKNKIVLNTDNLLKALNKYRKFLIKCCDDIYNIRMESLNEKIEMFSFDEKNSIIKFNKKDFTDINKKIKNTVKKQLNDGYSLYILNNIDMIFDKKVDSEMIKKINLDISKYMKNIYQKQVLESLDIKILVKDTILINSCKEQSDRYLFAINNSRLLKTV